MTGYNNADDWSGGEWVTAGDRSAVIFAGTKGRGNFWYGFSNGVVWPDNPPYPEIPPPPHDDRGWWADSFEGVIIFYDPGDLAKVAAGSMAPWEPQPYAEMKVDRYLWHITGPVQKMHVGDVAFDDERGFLYIAEPFADGDQPIIHVFSVRATASATGVRTGQVSDQATPAPSGSQKGGQTETATVAEIPADQKGVLETTRAPGYGAGLACIGIAAHILRRRGRH
ncbi:MAG: hypothetical protein A4E35_01331 [Methanoregula sp. PtaU1.Bin051]|nr:MAG: hypothetical protein A4E35_01331 [Methanoregula sp. PtaU1.Bin051]